MLKAASRAVLLLDDSADLVAAFLRRQINPDGGFKNRFGQSDLYYTVFGIEALLALNEDVPQEQILGFLQRFSDCESLDFIHLACLVRCLADLGLKTQACTGRSRGDSKQRIGRVGFSPPSLYKKKSVGQAPPYSYSSLGSWVFSLESNLSHCIEKYRSKDGGYSNSAGSAQGTAYGCFLALGAYQDLLELRIENLEFRKMNSIVGCVKSLQRLDGGYANEPSSKISSAPATAAAVTILHYLNKPINPSSTVWLLSCFHPQGGFAVMPRQQGIVSPDLLSTATALHALSLLEKLKIENSHDMS